MCLSEIKCKSHDIKVYIPFIQLSEEDLLLRCGVNESVLVAANWNCYSWPLIQVYAEFLSLPTAHQKTNAINMKMI